MTLRTLWIVSLILVSVSAFSQSEKEIYSAHCSACHQSNGEGSIALGAPNLSGLSEAYVARQLHLFQSNLRGASAEDIQGQMMKASVLMLSDAELKKLAYYVGNMADVSVNSEKQSTGFRGRGLYSTCSSCHGAQGEGNSALGAPRINQQYPWYLKRQLESYRKGWRGNNSSDELGQQMRTMALSIDEADIELLIRHISGMGLNP